MPVGIQSIPSATAGAICGRPNKHLWTRHHCQGHANQRTSSWRRSQAGARNTLSTTWPTPSKGRYAAGTPLTFRHCGGRIEVRPIAPARTSWGRAIARQEAARHARSSHSRTCVVRPRVSGRRPFRRREFAASTVQELSGVLSSGSPDHAPKDESP